MILEVTLPWTDFKPKELIYLTGAPKKHFYKFVFTYIYFRNSHCLDCLVILIVLFLFTWRVYFIFIVCVRQKFYEMYIHIVSFVFNYGYDLLSGVPIYTISTWTISIVRT